MTSVVLVFLSIASQMKPGTAELVIHNRQTGNAWVELPQHLPVTHGFIAVQDCNDLGQVWWAKNPLNGTWESMLVIDCAYPGDGTLEWMQENNIAFEVGYRTAERWNTVGRGVMVEWAKEKPERMVLAP